MRGKPGALNVPHSSSRIIPAHAGQTLRCCCRRCDIPDHPRACGANNPDCDRVVQDAGSSPRMRGKHFHEVRVFDLGRIIPAHAGQTGFWVNTSMSPPDHPRACGANSASDWVEAWRTGSSPRMRGKRLIEVMKEGDDRIIPAHAGQTTELTSLKSTVSDHPRACGANHLQRRNLRLQAGSSPRMRGKRAVPERQR